jgi:hypothetical protein
MLVQPQSNRLEAHQISSSRNFLAFRPRNQSQSAVVERSSCQNGTSIEHTSRTRALFVSQEDAKNIQEGRDKRPKNKVKKRRQSGGSGQGGFPLL